MTTLPVNQRPWYELSEEEWNSSRSPRDIRFMRMPILSPDQLEGLCQLGHQVRGDGYVISKSIRDELVQLGLVARFNGFNVITISGVAVLETLGMYLDSGQIRKLPV